jgi:hypothetical protein
VDFEGDTLGPSEHLQDSVVAILTEMGIPCQNVISSDPMDKVLRHFHVSSLPAVLIYNSQGRLHKRLDGSHSYQMQVLPEVERLLHSD